MHSPKIQENFTTESAETTEKPKKQLFPLCACGLGGSNFCFLVDHATLQSCALLQEDCKVDFLNRQDRQENDEFCGETAISLSFIPWRSWRPWRFFMTLQFSVPFYQSFA